MSTSRPDAAVGSASSLLIAQLARGTRRRIEQAVAPTGLRPRELVTLQHLQERGPSAQQSLAELVGVDATNLVAVLNNLEDAGLIDRRRDRADRRRAIIALSAQGERLLANLDRALAEIDDHVFAALTPVERDTLNELLTRAIQHIAQGCGPRLVRVLSGSPYRFYQPTAVAIAGPQVWVVSFGPKNKPGWLTVLKSFR